MNIRAIGEGDVVEIHCKRGDRRFYAVVTGRGDRELTFEPINRNCPYYFATPREVLAHWAARPNSADGPRTRAIRPDDLIVLAPGAGGGFARVLARNGRHIHIEALPTPSRREIAAAHIARHYARRGRRRKPTAA